MGYNKLKSTEHQGMRHYQQLTCNRWACALWMENDTHSTDLQKHTLATLGPYENVSVHIPAAAGSK